jgi:hypothetical protein
MTDLEQQITAAAHRCCLAKTQAEHAPLWLELVRLIAMRSPEEVRRMEQEKGLV